MIANPVGYCAAVTHKSRSCYAQEQIPLLRESRSVTVYRLWAGEGFSRSFEKWRGKGFHLQSFQYDGCWVVFQELGPQECICFPQPRVIIQTVSLFLLFPGDAWRQMLGAGETGEQGYKKNCFLDREDGWPWHTGCHPDLQWWIMFPFYVLLCQLRLYLKKKSAVE